MGCGGSVDSDKRADSHTPIPAAAENEFTGVEQTRAEDSTPTEETASSCSNKPGDPLEAEVIPQLRKNSRNQSSSYYSSTFQGEGSTLLGKLPVDDFMLAAEEADRREATTPGLAPGSEDLFEAQADDPQEEVLEFVSALQPLRTPRSPSKSKCQGCAKYLPIADAKYCPYCGKIVTSFFSSGSVSPGSKGLEFDDDAARTSSPVSKGNRTKVRISRRTENILGKGSYGIVYGALDVANGRPLAVKEISANFEDEDSMRVIRRELRNLSALRHPNVIEYDGCLVRRYPTCIIAILMERLECGSLEDLLSQFSGSGIPEGAARSFVQQLLSAVAYVHANGVTHRDIKPGNILLTSSGEIKLNDFGSALDVVAAADPDIQVAGTVPYMPPEVMEVLSNKSDSLHYGKAHDIWSVGCTVYHLLTGIRPWSEVTLTPYELVKHIRQQQRFPIPPDVVLSVDARSFIEQCLEVDHRKRSSADELLTHPFVVLEHESYVESPMQGSVQSRNSSFYSPCR